MNRKYSLFICFFISFNLYATDLNIKTNLIKTYQSIINECQIVLETTDKKITIDYLANRTRPIFQRLQNNERITDSDSPELFATDILSNLYPRQCGYLWANFVLEQSSLLEENPIVHLKNDQLKLDQLNAWLYLYAQSGQQQELKQVDQIIKHILSNQQNPLTKSLVLSSLKNTITSLIQANLTSDVVEVVTYLKIKNLLERIKDIELSRGNSQQLNSESVYLESLFISFSLKDKIFVDYLFEQYLDFISIQNLEQNYDFDIYAKIFKTFNILSNEGIGEMVIAVVDLNIQNFIQGYVINNTRYNFSEEKGRIKMSVENK